MLFRKKFLFGLIFIFSSISTAFSQTDQNELDAIFDDGNISTAKNIVKLNPPALLAGDLPLLYERKLSDALMLEVGVGYLLNIKSYELTLPMDQLGREPRGSGFSIWLNPKLFLTGDAPEGYYMGLFYRRRQYSSGLVYSDFCLNNGFQVNLDGRYMLDFMYGSGIRFVDDPDQQTGFYQGMEVKLIFPVAVKFGYLF